VYDHNNDPIWQKECIFLAAVIDAFLIFRGNAGVENENDSFVGDTSLPLLFPNGPAGGAGNVNGVCFNSPPEVLCQENLWQLLEREDTHSCWCFPAYL
jgi:hypothetical protein